VAQVSTAQISADELRMVERRVDEGGGTVLLEVVEELEPVTPVLRRQATDCSSRRPSGEPASRHRPATGAACAAGVYFGRRNWVPATSRVLVPARPAVLGLTVPSALAALAVPPRNQLFHRRQQHDGARRGRCTRRRRALSRGREDLHGGLQ
jgi:hypothetical protein